MERIRLLTFAVIGLLILNLLTITFLILRTDRPGQPNRLFAPPPGGRGPARVIIARLHFDEQQQQRYQTMVRQHQQQTALLQDKSVHLFQAYYALLALATPDSANKRALTQQIADNQRQIAELNFAHFQQIKSLCRPAQQADFTRLVADLTHLFGKPQRPPRPGDEGPAGEHPAGTPENFPPAP